MKCLSICFFINLFVCLAANGQQAKVPEVSKKSIDTSLFYLTPSLFLPTYTYNAFTPKPTYKSLPPSYYTNSLPFFCQKELQMEKAIKFPVKMRLGSVTYTDKLEGKITARGTE